MFIMNYVKMERIYIGNNISELPAGVKSFSSELMPLRCEITWTQESLRFGKERYLLLVAAWNLSLILTHQLCQWSPWRFWEIGLIVDIVQRKWSWSEAFATHSRLARNGSFLYLCSVFMYGYFFPFEYSSQIFAQLSSPTNRSKNLASPLGPNSKFNSCPKFPNSGIHNFVLLFSFVAILYQQHRSSAQPTVKLSFFFFS